MPTIASKLTGDNLFHHYVDGPSGRQPSGKTILIKGGHGLALERGHGIHTETGAVVTTVTDEELAILEQDETFKTQVKGGWLIVHQKDKLEGETVITDMNPERDGSAQRVPEDFSESDDEHENAAEVAVVGAKKRGRKAKAG